MKEKSVKAGWKPVVRIAGILPALLLALAGVAQAQGIQKVTVTGDRVSLRAAPKLTAVILERTSLNDQLMLADNSNSEWVGVRPPDSVDLWVHGNYIREDVVLPARLNIRSGPSLSHEVVGEVERGEKLTIRGNLRGWIRIAPPAQTVAWISRKYTDVSTVRPEVVLEEPILITGTEAPAVKKESNIIITVEPVKPVAAEVVEAKPVKVEMPVVDAEPVVTPVQQPIMNDLMVAAAELPELPEVLTPDPKKEQGVPETFSGILQPANAILYKLVDPRFESIVICYVRGNQSQMEAYTGRSLVLTGRAYWAAGLDQPFLVPEKINVLSEASVE